MTKEEFENIYRQHYAKMYRLARTMLYDVDESKDVVSDIFARDCYEIVTDHRRTKWKAT